MKVLYERVGGPASTSMPPPWPARSPTGTRQAQTPATVAEALAARGETKQARHVASVACAVGRWTMALMPVLSLEPSAISATDP
jgi:hypothetical protein